MEALRAALAGARGELRVARDGLRASRAGGAAFASQVVYWRAEARRAEEAADALALALSGVEGKRAEAARRLHRALKWPPVPEAALAALAFYRDQVGASWRTRLRLDWLKGGSDHVSAPETWAPLQALRNTHGHAWLDSQVDHEEA